jgi:NAD kinase
LKFGIFVHPERPKIPADTIIGRLERAGFSCCQNEADIAVAVGGDGTFGYFGRTLPPIPILFVGVKERNILGSKAKLAETTYENLEKSLDAINHDRYSVVEKEMISVSLNGSVDIDVLTDIYMERGAFSGCIRYKVAAFSSKNRQLFNEYAIWNGVIISTSYGSGGYFSYPDRLKCGNWKAKSPVKFPEGRIGICHIVPTYLVNERNRKYRLRRSFRHTVPNHSKIRIKIVRDANVRLFGTTVHSEGVSVKMGDEISISNSARTARIIKLN